jgi:hypothetical protein
VTDTEEQQTETRAAERRSSRRDGRALVEAWAVAVGAIVLVAVVGLSWALLRSGRADAGRVAHADAANLTVAEAKAPEPSAVFGHMDRFGVKLHFPASAKDMVGIGFHQAWNTKATDMVPELTVHPNDEYGATRAAIKADPTLKLFLMMARGRGSSDYSAADCAVRPGATVLSPVTGTVTLVKTYKLSGYGTDYRVEIEAEGASPVRVVMIHLQDVKVKEGQRVEGGLTPVAVVRHLGSISSQVNRYLPVPVDHTHVQINAVGYKLNESS